MDVVHRETAWVGEGPVWMASERAVYWLDIKGMRLFRHDAGGGMERVYLMPERIGAVIPRAQGGFVLLGKSGVYTSSAALREFTKVCAPDSDQPQNRFNDAKCDPTGRLWAGTMDDDEKLASGRLYRFDALDNHVRFKDQVNLSNGLGWSPDHKTMYFVETLRGVIWAYDYDVASGDAARERVFAEIPRSDGFPDGMCVDADGCVWLAHWGGARLTRFTPRGRIDRVVPVPAPQVTSCAFGGDALDTLYVTTAAIGMDVQARQAHPLAGSLFAFKPGVQGVPVSAFRG